MPVGCGSLHDPPRGPVVDLQPASLTAVSLHTSAEVGTHLRVDGAAQRGNHVGGARRPLGINGRRGRHGVIEAEVMSTGVFASHRPALANCLRRL